MNTHILNESFQLHILLYFANTGFKIRSYMYQQCLFNKKKLQQLNADSANNLLFVINFL